MGEYAKYHGERIKIGTCEDMYYLRANQRFWLTESDVDFSDPKQLSSVRFRFPFPNEDDVPPGGDFHGCGFERGVMVEGCSPPYEVNHDPYNRGKVCSKPNRFQIIQQRFCEGVWMLIGRCPECNSIFNFGEDPTGIIPVLEACKAHTIQADLVDSANDGDFELGKFWLEMAIRIAAGYGINPSKKTPPPRRLDSADLLGRMSVGDIVKVGRHKWEVRQANGTAVYAIKAGTKGTKLYKIDGVSLVPPIVEVIEVSSGSGTKLGNRAVATGYSEGDPLVWKQLEEKPSDREAALEAAVKKAEEAFQKTGVVLGITEAELEAAVDEAAKKVIGGKLPGSFPTSFHVNSDPGHGWISVKRELLVRMEIADKISSYSYQKGGTVYLEEDGDAALFIETYKGMTGQDPQFTEKHTNHQSRIRSYEQYRFGGE